MNASTSRDVLDTFTAAAEAVRNVLAANTDWGASGVRDGQYAVDLDADEACLKVLYAAGFRVLSEESGVTVPEGGSVDAPIVVVDPLDGSGNVAYRLAFNTLRDAYLQLLPLLTQVLAVEYEDRAPYRAIASAVRGGDCAEAERLARQIIDAGAAALGPTLDLIASTRGDIE